jgi:phage/plasmid-like protein (TIGR03299 family)
MGNIPEQAFFVREPAWHGVGAVLDDYPGREEAMRLAGHDFDVVELDELRVAVPNVVLAGANLSINPDGNGFLKAVKGWKVHVRSDDPSCVLNVSKESYQAIPNRVAYDFAEALLDQGFKYDAGITMDGGRQNAITLLLDEPITITGDNSTTLPYYACSWSHDGSGSLKGRSTSVRNVCQNTVSASEAEGKRLGTDFTIRHTKNWRDYVEDAKKAIQGARASLNTYQVEMERLAAIPITHEQRDLFISEILGETVNFRPVASTSVASKRVQTNVHNERTKITRLFFGETIPEAHALTGYGLHLAGVEYFDHLRAYRSKESYVKRTILTDNPAKASLVRTIDKLSELATV